MEHKFQAQYAIKQNKQQFSHMNNNSVATQTAAVQQHEQQQCSL
jgi:hypothetical protein